MASATKSAGTIVPKGAKGSAKSDPKRDAFIASLKPKGSAKSAGTIEPTKPTPKAKPQQPTKTAPKVATFATKSAKGKAEPTTYADILNVVNKPLEERGELAIGRNGAKVAPRRFHLTAEKVEALRAEWKDTKAVPNPQNAGAYHAFIEALKALGANKAHAFQAVKTAMRKAMSAAETKDENDTTAWQRFAGKEAHTEDESRALPIDGKIHQNAEVLQRLGGFTPYGLKLLQVGTLVMRTKGCVVDIIKGAKGERLYRLNTNAAEPTNEFRNRRAK